MKAEPAHQLRLLDLQALDTTITQLAHRRSHLDEMAALADVAANHETVAGQREQAAADLAAIDKQIKGLEDEVETLKSRARKDRARMDSGAVPAKELESLAHEVATLNAKQSELEELELELMQEQEDAATVLNAISVELQALSARRDELTATRDEQWRQIDASSDEARQARGQLVDELPAPLVARYDRALAKGGTGAALLRARRCGGCQLELSGTELAAANSAKADEVVLCENCGCVLVRTEESGLS